MIGRSVCMCVRMRRQNSSGADLICSVDRICSSVCLCSLCVCGLAAWASQRDVSALTLKEARKSGSEAVGTPGLSPNRASNVCVCVCLCTCIIIGGINKSPQQPVDDPNFTAERRKPRR